MFRVHATPGDRRDSNSRRAFTRQDHNLLPLSTQQQPPYEGSGTNPPPTSLVRMTGFEPATSRHPSEHSTQTELHPDTPARLLPLPPLRNFRPMDRIRTCSLWLVGMGGLEPPISSLRRKQPSRWPTPRYELLCEGSPASPSDMPSVTIGSQDRSCAVGRATVHTSPRAGKPEGTGVEPESFLHRTL
jgi:hypothetical protein